jgi:hypothetical protein
MDIEFVGLITLTLGVLCFLLGSGFAVYVFVISTLFGASAAIVLSALSNANVQPPHLLLGFLVAHLVTRNDFWRNAGGCMKFPRAGFWLLLTLIYGIVSAVLMPRLFAGSTYVYAIRESNAGYLIPLGPSSGNVTQTVYFIGDFICFVAFSALASTTGFRTIAYAALACAALNLVFALLDLMTFWANSADLLTFLRNSTYRMHNDTEIAGLKRIVGSFSEASSFAAFTLGLFIFTGKLWLSGIFPRLTFALAASSLCALLFATSTTGYVGLLVTVVLLYLSRLGRMLTGPVNVQTLGFICAFPLLISMLVIVIALNDAKWSYIHDLLENLIFNKLSSDSGVERTQWNRQALTNFVERFGVGVGIGSLRASSFPIAVLASIGVIGGLTYSAFLAFLLVGRRERGEDMDSFAIAVQSAARWACLAWLVAASVAGAFIDLGLLFYVFAALACAEPAHVRSPTSYSALDDRLQRARAA